VGYKIATDSQILVYEFVAIVYDKVV